MPLKELRLEIYRLDVQLIELLNQRARLSIQVGMEKQQLKLPIYNQQREIEVIENVVKQNKGPLTMKQAKSIFQVIIDSCRTIQQNQKGINNGNRDEE